VTRVRLIEGTDLAAHAEGIRQGYAHVFAAPPWNEDPSAGALYVERLADDAARPGFTAALALDGATVGGFATAWTTPVVFPSGRSYGHAAQALGPDRVTAWLCGALEVDELAVSPGARGAGQGAALLSAVTGAAPDGRCRPLTSVHAGAALRFYRRAGRYQVQLPVPGRAGLTVLLGPAHPAAPGLADRAEPAYTRMSTAIRDRCMNRFKSREDSGTPRRLSRVPTHSPHSGRAGRPLLELPAINPLTVLAIPV